jgi:hypothetical protein
MEAQKLRSCILLLAVAIVSACGPTEDEGPAVSSTATAVNSCFGNLTVDLRPDAAWVSSARSAELEIGAPIPIPDPLPEYFDLSTVSSAVVQSEEVGAPAFVLDFDPASIGPISQITYSNRPACARMDQSTLVQDAGRTVRLWGQASIDTNVVATRGQTEIGATHVEVVLVWRLRDAPIEAERTAMVLDLLRRM